MQEGNEGEGQEVVYSVGGDDGREFGYVYFQDDFSWVTEDYKGPITLAGWPSNTAETYWERRNRRDARSDCLRCADRIGMDY